MCVTTDISHQQPPIRVTSGGGVDYDHYRKVAREERIRAQRAALGAMGRWLRSLFAGVPVASHQERLG